MDYEKPELQALGSLAEMTEGAVPGGADNGSLGTPSF